MRIESIQPRRDAEEDIVSRLVRRCAAFDAGRDVFQNDGRSGNRAPRRVADSAFHRSGGQLWRQRRGDSHERRHIPIDRSGHGSSFPHLVLPASIHPIDRSHSQPEGSFVNRNHSGDSFGQRGVFWATCTSLRQRGAHAPRRAKMDGVGRSPSSLGSNNDTLGNGALGRQASYYAPARARRSIAIYGSSRSSVSVSLVM
jgi:hypothetical protein